MSDDYQSTLLRERQVKALERIADALGDIVELMKGRAYTDDENMQIRVAIESGDIQAAQALVLQHLRASKGTI